MVLIAKLGWSLYTSPNSLREQSLKAKCPGGKHLHLASVKASASWVWQGIWAVRQLIAKGVCCLPRSGSSLCIWQDPSVSSLPNFRPSPAALISSGAASGNPDQLVCSLFDYENLTWNRELLFSLFDGASAEPI